MYDTRCRECPTRTVLIVRLCGSIGVHIVWVVNTNGVVTEFARASLDACWPKPAGLPLN